jgi:selenide,water dikinase
MAAQASSVPSDGASVSYPRSVETAARLTRFSHGAGCACKLGPRDLTHVMELLGPVEKPEDVLVSEETGDDAAVYRLSEDSALVLTLDFFTPLVDDAADWGRIAAANAISDVYAMGGTPKIALNIAGWPVDELPLELLADVLGGAREIATRAGVAVVGGHTITTEKEPLFGMAVTGSVDPDRVVRNSTAAAGMRLFLSKPIGTGLITTAIKRGLTDEAHARLAIDTMTTLNAEAAAAMVRDGAAAGTDVTGFGLLGHLRRMLEASGCAAVVRADAVPLLPDVLSLAQRDVVAGGTKRNHAWLQEVADWGELTTPEQIVLADAQTSGGLLVATTGAMDPSLFAEIGETVDGRPGSIGVTGRIRE